MANGSPNEKNVYLLLLEKLHPNYHCDYRYFLAAQIEESKKKI